MDKKLTLHLVQWRVAPGRVEENLARAADLIEKAGPSPGALVLLPEMFPSGFYYEDLAGVAGRYDDVLHWMGSLATRHGVGMTGSMAVHRPEGVANTMVILDQAANVLASYDKAHLFSVAGEDSHFVPGDRTVVARFNGLDLGLSICFDLRFPEVIRELGDRGAKVVLTAAQWPLPRADHFRDFVRVRAMENQLYVAACNSCGDDGKGLVLGGGSTVVGPYGDVKGVLDENEGVLTVTIDLGEIDHAREKFPVLKMRREDLFGK